MRRLVIFAAVLLTGCGGPAEAPKAKEAAKPPEPAYFKVDPAQAGSLRVRVSFAGKKPQARRISMAAEEDCQKLHPQGVIEETLITGKRGGLANAVVYIKTGLENRKFEPPKEAVTIDQRGCMFVPRVVALREGQTLAVKNSDPVSHNIHPRPVNNREWNQQQPPGAPDLARRFARGEVVIPVRCNVHNWMRSYIAVIEHPYFAVTATSGESGWANVPAGEYVVAAWHETLGEKTVKASVAAGGKTTVELRFGD